MALVPARIVRAPGSVPVRRSSCRSRQATSGPKYTRQTRTKKCGQGRANGGLGRGERRRSHVGERVERNDESHLGSQPETARDRDKTQGDVRASSSGRHIAKKRCGGRGTGAVTATGSYEGSLTMEGASDHLQRSVFTGR
jgi:hypothetical protein